MTDTAQYYDRYWRPEGFQPSGTGFKEIREFVDAHVGPGQRWLDLGCGDGRTSGVQMTRRGADYVGVDVSRTAVEQARAAGLSAQVIGDAADLPFDDDGFAGAVAVEVLEHLFEPQRAARELLRVLAPGGKLFITLPNVAYWRRRLELLLLGRFDPIGDDRSVDEPWRDPHIRFFTPGTLERMLVRAGFCDVVVHGHSGAFLADLPKVGRRLGGRKSRAYDAAERVAPALMGKRINAIAHKPAA